MRPQQSTGVAIPLSALRADLDRGWPASSRWVAATRGVAELEHLAGDEVCFRIHACGLVRLRGEARVVAPPATGRSLLLSAAVRRPGVATKVIWRGRTVGLGQRRLPTRLRLDVECEFPVESELVFTASGGEGALVRWGGVTLSPSGEQQATPAVPDEQPLTIDDSPQPAESAPLFSVLTPVHDPPLNVLEETIASVLEQSLDDWELCLVDDGSSDPEVIAALRRYAEADPRIHLRRREVAGGIVAATNEALAMAGGEYVALLDHDDMLLPEALTEVATALREQPGTDMLYSDEQLLDESGPGHTFAKPHWSPDLLRSQMYTCHLGVYRRRLATEVGGFRQEFEGSQDFDFALRVSERTNRVVHLPRVLYRWRAHAGSTAGNAQAKPAAYPAARRAIAEHLERTGIDAAVYFGPWQGIYRVVHRLPVTAEVAVGVVADDADVASLRMAIEDGESSGVPRARLIAAATTEEIFAASTDADAVILCEGPVKPLTRLWLSRLASFALQPGIAAVGARTVAPDGRIELSGEAIDGGLPRPLMFGAAAGDPGPLGVGLLPANVAMVTGAVAFGRDALTQLGPPGTEFSRLATADFCLRGLSAGLRVVSAADVLLRRLGPAPDNDLDELARFGRRWAPRYPRDPYFDLGVVWPGVEVNG